MRQRYGYTDDQIRPYAFSLAPFLADKTRDPAGVFGLRAVFGEAGRAGLIRWC